MYCVQCRRYQIFICVLYCVKVLVITYIIYVMQPIQPCNMHSVAATNSIKRQTL